MARRSGLWSPGWIWVWLEGGGPTATKTGLWPQGEGGLNQQGGSVCTGSVLQRHAGTSEASGSEKGLEPRDPAGLSYPRPSSFHSLKTRHDLLYSNPPQFGMPKRLRITARPGPGPKHPPQGRILTAFVQSQHCLGAKQRPALVRPSHDDHNLGPLCCSHRDTRTKADRRGLDFPAGSALATAEPD